MVVTQLCLQPDGRNSENKAQPDILKSKLVEVGKPTTECQCWQILERKGQRQVWKTLRLV